MAMDTTQSPASRRAPDERYVELPNTATCPRTNGGPTRRKTIGPLRGSGATVPGCSRPTTAIDHESVQRCQCRVHGRCDLCRSDPQLVPANGRDRVRKVRRQLTRHYAIHCCMAAIWMITLTVNARPGSRSLRSRKRSVQNMAVVRGLPRPAERRSAISMQPRGYVPAPIRPTRLIRRHGAGRFLGRSPGTCCRAPRHRWR